MLAVKEIFNALRANLDNMIGYREATKNLLISGRCVLRSLNPSLTAAIFYLIGIETDMTHKKFHQSRIGRSLIE